MTIQWKAVEQYFTVVLFVNPLTPRVEPWVIKGFLTFDSIDRSLKCDHSLAVEQYLNLVLLFFNFTQFVIFQNLSISDLALSG